MKLVTMVNVELMIVKMERVYGCFSGVWRLLLGVVITSYYEWRKRWINGRRLIYGGNLVGSKLFEDFSCIIATDYVSVVVLIQNEGESL